jgi:hypothetical protein
VSYFLEKVEIEASDNGRLKFREGKIAKKPTIIIGTNVHLSLRNR